jgi:hypothetical protein
VEKLARFVDKEENIGVKLIVSAHVLERISHVASTGIKQRYYPIRGFRSFTSASRFCQAFDEVRQVFRVRTTMEQKISLAEQHLMFRQRLDVLKAMFAMA